MVEELHQSEEEALLEKIVRNQLEIARLQEENDTLKGFIKERPEAYPVGTKHVGKFYLKVTTNRRVDDATARRELDPVTYDRLTKKVIDSTLAKRVLPPATYEKIVKVYENRIEVGLR